MPRGQIFDAIASLSTNGSTNAQAGLELGYDLAAWANRPGVTPEPHSDVQKVPHQMVPLPMMDISSTAIRAQVAQGKGVTDLVPPAVARYIDQNDLYRGTPRS